MNYVAMVFSGDLPLPTMVLCSMLDAHIFQTSQCAFHLGSALQLENCHGTSYSLP